MQNPSDIRFADMDLCQHGLNPSGEPVYRVVWADSRVENVWHDGKMIPLKLYDGHANGKRVLEKWKPCAEAVGLTREQYAEKTRELGVDMEYPSLGDYYDMAILVEGAGVNYVRALIEMNQHDVNNVTPAEKAKRLRDAMARDQKAVDEKKDAVIQSVLERKDS